MSKEVPECARELCGVLDDERPPLVKELEGLAGIPMAGTEDDRYTKDGGLEHVMDALPEAPADVGHVGASVQAHENTDAVDQQNTLAGIVTQRGES